MKTRISGGCVQRHVRSVACLGAAALIAACATTAPPPPSSPAPAPAPSASPTQKPLPINLSGYKPAFKEGFRDGCESFRGAYRRDNARFNTDTDYAIGWQDGFSICRRQGK